MSTITQHIVLVGLMGVGKSAIGRQLSKKFSVPFIDVDHAVEREEGRKITEIFAQDGEAHFRHLEQACLERCLKNAQPHIIASGGGLFMQERNRELIKQHATSVWISVDVDILVERCSRKKTRPLLLQGDPKEILTDLKEKRYPIYKEADIHVRGDNSPVTRLVETIATLIEER